MKENENKELIGVYLYPHEARWLKEKADKDQRSLSEYARLVLITKMPQK